MGHASRVPAVGSRRHPANSRPAPRLGMVIRDGRNENSSDAERSHENQEVEIQEGHPVPAGHGRGPQDPKTGTVVAPVDVMMGIGFLTKECFEDWRFGRVPYLERVITCNLSKALRVLKILKNHAEERGLKRSLTVYKKWGKGRKGVAAFFEKRQSLTWRRYTQLTMWPAAEKARPREEPPEDPKAGVEAR